ncbi:13240_t:CDS:1, partial [Cetraspora pellucida]
IKSEEISKEEVEMEGIENTENMNIAYIEKKIQQYEMSNDEEASTNLNVVINQMQDLSISTLFYKEPIVSDSL